MIDSNVPYETDNNIVNVVHKTTREYKINVNANDHPTTDWIHNPDTDLIASDYWKVSGSTIVEMNQNEKDSWDLVKQEMPYTIPVFSVSLSKEDKFYTRISSSSLKTVQQILFPGLNALGNISKIKLIAWLLSSGESLFIKIVDITNNKTITTIQNVITTTNPTCYTITDINNLSEDVSIWEVQAKKSNTNGAISSIVFYR